MLLSFTVGGFCSYNAPQTLDLTAPAGARLKGTQYEENFAVIGKHRVMKSALLFGANASGKTNLILALAFCIDIIKIGLQLSEKEKKNFFKNNIKNRYAEAVEFEIELLGKNEEVYTYYVKFNEIKLLAESLKKNENMIYEFTGKELKTNNKVVPDLLKASLEGLEHTDTLLKKMKDWRIQEIADIREITKNILIERESVYDMTIKGPFLRISEEIKMNFTNASTEIVRILQMLDVSITGISFEFLGVSEEGEKEYKLHIDRDKEKFAIEIESSGIKKIVERLFVLLSISKGATVILDELDSSISTTSLIQIFNEIINSNTNAMGQLIVTTHNPLLFDNAMFHPSQIYLVEKGENLSSELYSLNEFDIRPDRKNLYVDFLKGKFGGVNV